VLFSVMATSDPRLVTLRYAVACAADEWTLDEVTVPEAHPHHRRASELEQLLERWAAASGRSIHVGGNLAIRWEEARPSIGVDPDVYMVEPAPPEGEELQSLRLWAPGHAPPLLAVEIVSANHPKKDYVAAPEKYAASGTKELWVFDPDLEGPRARGGPYRLQVWQRDERGEFTRVYAGPGPTRSGVLGAWLFAVDEGRRLRIADDEHGTLWWTTAKEAALVAERAERAAKELALAAERSERAAKEAALIRISELEAELARRTRG